MELPNYFLADLPDQSTLTPTLVTDACLTLKRNRERFLAPRSTESLITLLASLAKEWRDPAFTFHQMILDRGSAHTGFSRESLSAGLDQFFARITKENLENLIVQDLGHIRRLDEMISDEQEVKGDRASTARGPDLLVQITGGVLPNPTITSIILGLLARSAQFIKCASGTAFIPRLFAHSLYQTDPKLGACLEVAEWPGGTEPLEKALFAEAGLVTATGNDDTITTIRQRLPAKTRFVGYGHKLSFAYVTREMLAKINLRKVITAAARDVIAWNQLGCLSPHVIYLEAGGEIPEDKFAESLADELRELETAQPRGPVQPDEAAAISTRRMFYDVRAANDGSAKVWASEQSTAWTVIFESDPQFQTSCLNRFIYLKPVTGLDQLLLAIEPVRGEVSTVGLSAPINRAQEIANKLAPWGVTRICPLGQMQNPPLTWRHDGRPSLGDLVTWSDWEFQ